MAEQLTRAFDQWASRPNDQRFLTIDELRDAVEARKTESWTTPVEVRDLAMQAETDGYKPLGLQVAVDTMAQGTKILNPTHWAFGQLAHYAGAPPSYLRKLTPELAAINVQWGLENIPQRDNALVLGQSNGTHMLRSMTSQSYGRIWDIDVVDTVREVNHDDKWKVPASSYTTENPRRATTLYASDRDVFIFLVDPDNPLDVNGETLFRGFFAWNSEVGSAVFGLSTFLYRYICDNRIVWGAQNVQELRIRHNAGAPDRFKSEGAEYLQRYSEASTAETVQAITAAQNRELTKTEKDDGDWASWLRRRGFGKNEANDAVKAAESEEGGARSLWDIVNGVTATARRIPHTDQRVKLESAAGRLLASVS